MKVLMLEDKPQLADMVSSLLELHDHDVTVTETVAAARAEYERTGPDWFDVLLCDYDLPDGTGLDFIQTIRGSDRARTIVWSGLDRTREVAASDAAPPDYLLAKSDLDELLAILATIDADAVRRR